MRGLVEQGADQTAHPVRRLVDDPEELQHLGRIGRRIGALHGGGQALRR